MSISTAADRRVLIGQAFELLRQGRIDEAQARSRSLLEAHADDPEVLYLGCEVQMAANAPAAALPLIQSADQRMPGQPQLLLTQARVLQALRRRQDLRVLAERIEALAGQDAELLWRCGRLHAGNNDPARARGLYQRALALAPGQPGLLYDLAAVEFFLGDFDAAEAHLEQMLSRVNSGQALYLRATLRRQTADRNHIEDLTARLARGFGDELGRAACLYALAKELEDVGESDRAFAALSEGARVMRSQLQPDLAGDLGAMAEIRQHWSAAAAAAASRGEGGEEAIFIVGLPRTGTTLVERMLLRSGDIAPAGELLDFGLLLAGAARSVQAQQPGQSLVQASLAIDYAALGRDYLAGAREAAPGAARFIDKMPVNFMYIGMIAQALPQARIIHLRRDPMDSAYAIYRTLFNQAYSWSYQLEELAEYLAAHHQLMAHWREQMPERFLEIDYEALVRDPEAQARRLCDWCGIAFDPAMLDPASDAHAATTASAAQVREAVHDRSVGRWQVHAEALQPLQRLLRERGVIG